MPLGVQKLPYNGCCPNAHGIILFAKSDVIVVHIKSICSSGFVSFLEFNRFVTQIVLIEIFSLLKTLLSIT